MNDAERRKRATYITSRGAVPNQSAAASAAWRCRALSIKAALSID